MSYACSEALQKAVYGALSGSVTLSDAVDGAIYDQVPSGQMPDVYVTLGPEKVLDRSDRTADGARHEFQVAVVSDQGGFSKTKSVGVIISDLLDGADLTLERGQLVDLRFVRAAAKRVSDQRRIDLVFRARVDDI